ncbi:MAG: MBL fold metallo-hydrolase, partial [Ignavibacteria bacterium]|nr:MBL fold metallo-hydrolase [Ignavibacteria bacterium]
MTELSMKIRFWGTRGSVPTPGKETVRYGGNTPCVEVRLANDELIIIDAGTGIRSLGDYLIGKGGQVKAHILISHPHWDHIQGFPFFKPAFVAGTELTIIGSETNNAPLNRWISDQMNSTYFPVRIDEMKAKISFRPIKEETLTILGASVSSLYVNHPAFALGFRLDYKGQTFVYVSDNEPFDPELRESSKNVDNRIVEKYRAAKGDPNERVYEFARGADILIHDSTYTPEEYASHIGWGHSHYFFALQ